MQIGTYTFHCRFSSPAVLPAFKGSTLRGGLGHALKKVSCALRRQECQGCLLFSTCGYAYLFEVKLSATTSEQIRTVHRPHPYVLIPPDDQKRGYEIGESFTFQLKLFGSGNEYLPHIIYGVQMMGNNGLGKRSQAAGTFSLEQVISDRGVVYSEDKIHVTDPPGYLALEPPPSGPISSVTVFCRTPLRLKHVNKLQSSLPFHLLVRAALRRCSSLEEAYGDGEPDIDYRGLVSRAAAIEIKESNTKWYDIERYSNRQKQSMRFGGIQGNIVYQGENLADYIPLLNYCEVTHLGKQTSFGLGEIRVQESRS